MPGYVGSLSSIVSFVDDLSRMQTGDVEPMAHPLDGQHQRLRADVVTESDNHEKYQAIGLRSLRAVRRAAGHRVNTASVRRLLFLSDDAA